jgi:acetolactate synthase I/II/III large subunit
MQIRVADYLVQELNRLTGNRHCFLLAGGGMMHLLDAIGRSNFHYVCMLHEQAVTIAADAYGRVNNTIGVAFVTSGPGVTNAITGVAGAWLESTPLIVISGQVSRATWKWDSGVRQMGFQEIDIVPMVRPITKYATIVLDPKEIRYHLEKAIFLARDGRPGPVWLDIPLDVQAALIEPSMLIGYDLLENTPDAETGEALRYKIKTTADMILSSQRPLILGGHGIWLSGAKEKFRELVELLRIPVQTSWNGMDLIEYDYPLYFGRHNSYGPRYANFVVQNCDLLLSIGSRLGLQQIGFNYKAYARAARKIVVDIDKAELGKKTIAPDLPVLADAKAFICGLIDELSSREHQRPDVQDWIHWCNQIKKEFPDCGPEYFSADGYVDPYVFIDTLSRQVPSETLVVIGSSGTGFSVSGQIYKVKKGQRVFSSKGLAAMGYGLPSSIGGCFAHGRKETITVIGDGGFQLNIQELQTIVHHNLPIKMFIFNNDGYISIRTTQNSFYDGFLVGSSSSSDVSLPKLQRVANCYGISYYRIENHEKLTSDILHVLQMTGPVICEVMLNPSKPPLPKLSSYKKPDGTMESRPIEDLYPQISREILRKTMLIDLWN